MFTKELKHALLDRQMKASELAKRLGCSPGNLSLKMKRDNFTEKDMMIIAKILEMELEITMEEE